MTEGKGKTITQHVVLTIDNKKQVHVFVELVEENQKTKYNQSYNVNETLELKILTLIRGVNKPVTSSILEGNWK